MRRFRPEQRTLPARPETPAGFLPGGPAARGARGMLTIYPPPSSRKRGHGFFSCVWLVFRTGGVSGSPARWAGVVPEAFEGGQRSFAKITDGFETPVARFVPDHRMNRVPVRQRGVLRISPVPLKAHGGNVREVSLSAHHIQRSVKAVPFIFDLAGDDGALSAKRPDSAQVCVQPEARLVHNPDFHTAACGNVERLKLCGQSVAKLLCGRGVFFGLHRPRPHQHSSGFFLASSTPWYSGTQGRAFPSASAAPAPR